MSPNRQTKTYDSQIKDMNSHGSKNSDEHDKINMPENIETSVSETLPTSPDNPEGIQDKEGGKQVKLILGKSNLMIV